MKLSLTRFWFEFEVNDANIYLFTTYGVTAWSYADAISLLDKQIFKGKPLPKVKKLIENVDVSALDANHILPNITNPPSVRGIWYPMGY